MRIRHANTSRHRTLFSSSHLVAAVLLGERDQVWGHKKRLDFAPPFRRVNASRLFVCLNSFCLHDKGDLSCKNGEERLESQLVGRVEEAGSQDTAARTWPRFGPNRLAVGRFSRWSEGTTATQLRSRASIACLMQRQRASTAFTDVRVLQLQ
jgi:hypothetical protein